MNINVSIERLVLEGLPVSIAQGPIVQAAIETELVRLLIAQGLSPTWRTHVAVPSLHVANIPLRGDSNPTQTGHQIANALMDGIGNDKLNNKHQRRLI
jgi:hypothetical protein